MQTTVSRKINLINNNNIIDLCLRLPYDWKTPLGYSLAMLEQSIAAYSSCASVVSMGSFFIGCCWLIISFVKDITNELNLLNDNATSGQSDGKLLMDFIKVVKRHANVKQLSIFAL